MLRHKKGFGQDQVFLLAGILILVITAWLIYTLIGGPYCDDLAKRTANNIKIAVDTVAKTGSYTKYSPYTTYAMLCQNKVGDPLSIFNPADIAKVPSEGLGTLMPDAPGYRAFAGPEYMIYWEHFPESPKNLASGFVVFDETTPFTKNFAQFAAINYGLGFVSGTASLIARSKIGTGVSNFASKITKSKAGKIANIFFTGAKWATVPVWGPFKLTSYIDDLAKRGVNKGFRFITAKTGIGKLINKDTMHKIYGKITGVSFVKSVTENGLVESVETSSGTAVKMVTVKKTGGTAVDKVSVSTNTADDLDENGKVIRTATYRKRMSDLIDGPDGLLASGIDEEKQMGAVLEDAFYYGQSDDIIVVDPRPVTIDDVIGDADSITDIKNARGFRTMVKANMLTGEEAYSSVITKLADNGLMAARPISGITDSVAMAKIGDDTIGKDVAASTGLFTKTTDNKLVPSPKAVELYDDYAEQTGRAVPREIIETPDKAYENMKGFLKSGDFLVPSFESDAAMPYLFEAHARESFKANKALFTKMVNNPIDVTAAELDDIAVDFANRVEEHAVTHGYPPDVTNTIVGRLKANNHEGAKRAASQYLEALKNTKALPAGTIDSAHVLDDTLEFASLEASMKSSPAMLVAMTDETATVMPKAGKKPGDKDWIDLIRMDAYTFLGPDYVEEQVKYSYLRSAHAGCESNTVCLNQKNVEQKKVDVEEDQIREYETAYVVSKNVDVKLKRDGFSSPIGAGFGAFVFKDNPRFHIVSPCLAQIKFYESETEDGVVIADVDKCPTPGRSNYCYFDEGKFNEMAVGFYSTLTCSVIADSLKPLAGFGFLVQPACASIEIFTEYDTTWPFRPFQPLRKEDMNILNCNIEKNPKDAAKLAIKACCGIAQCTGNFECSGIDYAEKNRLICGADKCTLEQLAGVTGEDYKTACGCS